LTPGLRGLRLFFVFFNAPRVYFFDLRPSNGMVIDKITYWSPENFSSYEQILGVFDIGLGSAFMAKLPERTIEPSEQ